MFAISSSDEFLVSSFYCSFNTAVLVPLVYLLVKFCINAAVKLCHLKLTDGNIFV